MERLLWSVALCFRLEAMIPSFSSLNHSKCFSVKFPFHLLTLKASLHLSAAGPTEGEDVFTDSRSQNRQYLI